MNAVTRSSGSTALHAAASSVSAFAVRVLLGRGANPGARGQGGSQTAVEIATLTGHPVVADVLNRIGCACESAVRDVLCLDEAARSDAALGESNTSPGEHVRPGEAAGGLPRTPAPRWADLLRRTFGIGASHV